jgi:23S rRNA (cytosine1962-C5)-methyltransferase
MTKPLRWLAPEQRAELEAGQTNCYRIAAGETCFVDWWDGRVLVSSALQKETASILRGLARWLEKTPGCGGPMQAVFHRSLKRNPGASDRPEVLEGSPQQASGEVKERGLRYGINLAEGYSAGLFPDQRENRMRLAARITARERPVRLLNLFAYTCAFSVAAARAGAHTTSVDLSRRYLEIGKSNFTRNAIPASTHKFVTEDAMRFFPRLIRRGEQFDFIILDPPTFARGTGGRTFQLERNFQELLRMAVVCAAPGASLLLSGNQRGFGFNRFREWARIVAPQAIAEPGIVPADFEGSPCSSTCWIQMP